MSANKHVYSHMHLEAKPNGRPSTSNILSLSLCPFPHSVKFAPLLYLAVQCQALNFATDDIVLRWIFPLSMSLFDTILQRFLPIYNCS